MASIGPLQNERCLVLHVTTGLQLAGAGLMLVGAFTPWLRSHALFLTVPLRGAETDYGRLFPVSALVVLALLAFQWSFGWRAWANGAVLLLGAVTLAVAVLYGVQVTQRVHRVAEVNRDKPGAPVILGARPAFSIEFDVGYYLTLLGAGGLLVGGVSGLRRSRSAGA